MAVPNRDVSSCSIPGNKQTSGAVIGVSREHGHGAIDLLEQHDPHELMRPSRGAERDMQVGFVMQSGRKTIGSADDEYDRWSTGIAPTPQAVGESRAVEILSAFPEHDRHGVVGDE